MIKKLQIYTQKDSFSNLKIAQISDYHYSFPKDLKVLDNAINKLEEIRPSYIIFSGDIVEESTFFDLELVTRICLLSNICPLIITLGNHDRMHREDKKWQESKSELEFLLREIPNVYLLDNEIVEMDEIKFIGLTLPFSWYEGVKKYDEEAIRITKILGEGKSTKYTCLVAHDPSIMTYMLYSSDYRRFFYGIDLVLTGHTHGGYIPPILDKVFYNNVGLTSENGKIILKNNQRGDMNFSDLVLNIAGALTTVPKNIGFTKVLKPFYPPIIDVIDIENSK